MAQAHADRIQILANAKIMLKPDVTQQNYSNGKGKDTGNGHSSSAGNTSQATLLDPHPHHELDVIVFGSGSELTAAVMWGLTPAIQGPPAKTTDGALRMLLLATAEMLHNHVPMIGNHQRAIHGGGIYNEDLVSTEITEARKMSI